MPAFTSLLVKLSGAADGCDCGFDRCFARPRLSAITHDARRRLAPIEIRPHVGAALAKATQKKTARRRSICHLMGCD
jgi:hypothetical protein